MAFYFYLSTKIIMVFITKSYQDLFGVRSYINALYKPFDHEIDFRSNEKCEKCWAQRLCGGCTVHRFFNHKINQFEAYPNEDFCKITLLCIEQILLIIASIRKDPQLWSLLIQKMNN